MKIEDRTVKLDRWDVVDIADDLKQINSMLYLMREAILQGNTTSDALAPALTTISDKAAFAVENIKEIYKTATGETLPSSYDQI